MRCIERFWVKVDRRGPDECWLWTGASKPNGYGNVRFSGVFVGPHRVAYELVVGPIPEGLEIDHLCRVRLCCNPSHLEPVTHAENVLRASLRRTHCKHGHELNAENLYEWRNHRFCKACRSRTAALLRAA